MQKLLYAIAEKERLAKELEPDEKHRSETNSAVIKYANYFLDNVNDLKAFQPYDADISKRFSDNFDLPETLPDILDKILKNVDEPGLNPASGGHLAYIPGGGIYNAALGDYLADVTNKYAGIEFTGPGAVALENSLLSWMAKSVGYPIDSAGNLTSGGSIANLIAITTARDAFELKAKNFDKTVIYLSEQAHHSIDKAIRIAGLKECILRHVELDNKFRMIPERLDALIAEDISNGLRPFLIVASAGTTDVGAIDPLEEIGLISKKYRLWYHVDGAYGGFFVLTAEGKEKLKGIELSDSLVMDPHKGLFLPYGLGAVLIKSRKKMHQAHYYVANYMQDAATENVVSPAELSPELTKHFRGMRLWFPLKVHGINPFIACLEEKLLLTRYFYHKIKEINGFETLLEPELSVVTYRYVPKYGDANAFNKKLVQAIQQDGRVFISSTMLSGKYVLRLAILSFRTHLSTIDLALAILKENSEKIALENSFAEQV